jgi:hypothetical protein
MIVTICSLQLAYSALACYKDGDVGIGVFPEGEGVLVGCSGSRCALTAFPSRAHKSLGQRRHAALVDHPLVSKKTPRQIFLSFENSADSRFSPADYHRRQHERRLFHHRHFQRNRRISHLATNSASPCPCLEPAPSSFAMQLQTALVYPRLYYLVFLVKRRKCIAHRAITRTSCVVAAGGAARSDC